MEVIGVVFAWNGSLRMPSLSRITAKHGGIVPLPATLFVPATPKVIGEVGSKYCNNSIVPV